MTDQEFENQRRQKFIYLDLYKNSRDAQLRRVASKIRQSSELISDQEYGYGHMHHSTCHQFIYLETLWLWMLDYTAGVDLDALAPRLTEIVDLFVEWHHVYKAYAKRLETEFGKKLHPDPAAPTFINLLDYEDTLQLLSIAIMLRDQISVRRIINCLTFYRGTDALFESLIAGYVNDAIDTDELFHEEPYQLLLDVYYEEDEGITLDRLQQYLKTWYPHMEGARWYDAHRNIVDDNAAYYGYWAFEAGATAYLLDLDDSQIDHMIYPKDLVAYGRKLREEDRYTSREGDTLRPTFYRVEAGQPCTRDGYWSTPAKLHSRKLFKTGDIMPDYPDSSYGATIWYREAE